MEKPLEVLKRSAGAKVIVSLRGGREFQGRLDGFDPHMNLVLRKAVEYLEGQIVRRTDIQIIRGDNVIFISPGRE